MNKYKHISNKLKQNIGVTLIEILISMAILSVILTSFLSAFILSTKSNVIAGNILDATYAAQDCMEDLYSLSINWTNDPDRTLMGNVNAALQSKDFKDRGDGSYDKYINDYYAKVQIRDLGKNRLNVIVRVYEKSSLTNLQAQMEHILAWNY
jgi:prepilin-type N-terminal cleavage/methylation domain-containing protein